MGGKPPTLDELNNLRQAIDPMDPGNVAAAMGARVFRCNPYDVEETVRVIDEATAAEGVKVVVAEALCYLKFGREGKLSFVPRPVAVEPPPCRSPSHRPSSGLR